ncbi:MAG: ribbon-helix-helix protein, CopG family [Crinalium sp.]
MSKPEIYITFRLTSQEKEILKAYCEQEGRNQTDVLRELIRNLRRRLKQESRFSSPT